MRTLLLWLHILGAATWFGVNVAQGAIGPKLTADRASALPWLRAVESRSGPVYGTASVLLLITGVILVVTSDVFTFASGFVGIGFAVVIVGGALAGLVFNRKTRQMIGMLESDRFEEVAPVYRSLGMWAVVDTILVAIAILSMVGKWGA